MVHDSGVFPRFLTEGWHAKTLKCSPRQTPASTRRALQQHRHNSTTGGAQDQGEEAPRRHRGRGITRHFCRSLVGPSQDETDDPPASNSTLLIDRLGKAVTVGVSQVGVRGRGGRSCRRCHAGVSASMPQCLACLAPCSHPPRFLESMLEIGSFARMRAAHGRNGSSDLLSHHPFTRAIWFGGVASFWRNSQ